MQSQALVSKITITNFQSIKKAELVFDPEGNILNIIGFNDVGKSAIIRALDCLLYFKYPSAQKSFIRRGEKFFQVAATFTDGVTIVLERFLDSNSSKAVYHMLDSDDKLLFSTARASINGGKTVYEKVVGVPPEISRYLNMGTFLISNKTTSLNSGNRYDPLLLVGTSGSDNTRALNSAMKSEELTEAHEAITKSNNALRGKISGREQVFNEISNMESKLRGVTQALGTALEEEAHTTQVLEDSISFKDKLVSSLEEYESITVPPEVSSINTSNYTNLGLIYKSIQDYSEIQVAPAVETISTQHYATLQGVEEVLNSLISVKVPPQVEELSGALLLKLQGVFKELHKYASNNATLVSLENTEKEVKAKQEKVAQLLESKGYVATYCGNCGELSVVDRDGNTVVGATTH